MFWHLLMISLITLGSIYWINRVMFLNDSRSLGHWLKSNVVDLLSVWYLTMVGNMWLDSLRISWFSEEFHGRGLSLTLLSRMAFLNERAKPLWRCLYVSYKSNTYRWNFGLNQSIVQTISWTRFQLRLFIKWLLLRSDLVRNPLLVILGRLDVLLGNIFHTIEGIN